MRLSNDTTEVVVDVSTGAPTIVHWGAPLGETAELSSVRSALDRPIVQGTHDAIAPVSVVPEHGSGFTGRPGLVGRRGGGRDWSPRFTTSAHDLTGGVLTVDAVDAVAGLALCTTIELD